MAGRYAEDYEALYRICADEHIPQTVSQRSVAELFASIDLPRATLKDMWSRADRTHDNSMSKDRFITALALISLAQRGKPATLAFLGATGLENIPPPKLVEGSAEGSEEGSEESESESGQSGEGHGHVYEASEESESSGEIVNHEAMGSVEDEYSDHTYGCGEHYDAYEALFMKCTASGDPSVVVSNKVGQLFTAVEGVSRETLRSFWSAADWAGQKDMSRERFFTALRLIRLHQDGKSPTLASIGELGTENIPPPRFVSGRRSKSVGSPADDASPARPDRASSEGEVVVGSGGGGGAELSVEEEAKLRLAESLARENAVQEAMRRLQAGGGGGGGGGDGGGGAGPGDGAGGSGGSAAASAGGAAAAASAAAGSAANALSGAAAGAAGGARGLVPAAAAAAPGLTAAQQMEAVLFALVGNSPNVEQAAIVNILERTGVDRNVLKTVWSEAGCSALTRGALAIALALVTLSQRGLPPTAATLAANGGVTAVPPPHVDGVSVPGVTGGGALAAAAGGMAAGALASGTAAMGSAASAAQSGANAASATGSAASMAGVAGAVGSGLSNAAASAADAASSAATAVSNAVSAAVSAAGTIQRPNAPVGLPSEEDLCEVRFFASDVEVSVGQLQAGTIMQYTLYKVTTGRLVKNHVHRRYSDFVWLYNELAKMYPFRMVPGLPDKKRTNKFDPEFVEERRLRLQSFLRILLGRPLFQQMPDVLDLFLNQMDYKAFERDKKAHLSGQMEYHVHRHRVDALAFVHVGAEDELGAVQAGLESAVTYLTTFLDAMVEIAAATASIATNMAAVGEVLEARYANPVGSLKETIKHIGGITRETAANRESQAAEGYNHICEMLWEYLLYVQALQTAFQNSIVPGQELGSINKRLQMTKDKLASAQSKGKGGFSRETERLRGMISQDEIDARDCRVRSDFALYCLLQEVAKFRQLSSDYSRNIMRALTNSEYVFAHKTVAVWADLFAQTNWDALV